jgi:hypothetical protein
MGDLENRVNDLLAAATGTVPWIDPFLRGRITLDDVSDRALLVGLTQLTVGLNNAVGLIAREVDLLGDDIRGTHDFSD